MERIKHGNVLMTIEDENKQEALELAKRFANIGYGIYATKGMADLFEAEGLYVHRASKIETEDGPNSFGALALLICCFISKLSS
jgi:hypothetical protein